MILTGSGGLNRRIDWNDDYDWGGHITVADFIDAESAEGDA